MWKTLWDSVMSMYSSCPFLTGILLGVVACAVISLLFCLIVRLCGASRVSVFSYPVTNGKITIRASAVTSLVLSLERNFPELVIAGAGLYHKGELVFLRVVVDYCQGRRPFPEVVSLFQQQVLDQLKESFGIGNVKQIEVCMRDSIAERTRSAE